MGFSLIFLIAVLDILLLPQLWLHQGIMGLVYLLKCFLRVPSLLFSFILICIYHFFCYFQWRNCSSIMINKTSVLSESETCSSLTSLWLPSLLHPRTYPVLVVTNWLLGRDKERGVSVIINNFVKWLIPPSTVRWSHSLYFNYIILFLF